ncbi:ATP-dependent helicase [Andreesenia angusta]|uniref:ATP-dependent helicase n=1 Tax=Andreesenia angusta TaxID=39480 RepID=UPI001FE124FA|nr:ATP-dependent helicase [Andreesenia angusta]
MIYLIQSFFQNIESDYNLPLNDSQKKAVLHNNGPALVLAVPGAGKTTVLISRVAALISLHGVKPSKILSITFSKASALDMQSRFYSTFGAELGASPKFSTIHSFAYFVIREYCRKAGVSYNLIEENGPNGKIQLLRNIYSSINKGFLSEDKLEELVNGIGYVKNMMLSPEEFKSPGIKNFPKIYWEYESAKKENKLLDFDDMLSLCLDILEKNGALLESYRVRYEYVQVDEGQDTSNIQHRIIALLVKPKNNLFIVADDDQSVYGFRGANPKYLLEFKTHYPDASVFNMNRNYRSTPDIVSIANSLIKQNKLRYDKDLVAHSESSHPVGIFKLDTQENQYRHLVDSLVPSEFEDTAVLFRNNISAIPIADILDRKGIPFKLKDSKLTFFNHWLLKDILSFLKLATDQSDTGAFERIYHKMKGYISKKGLNYVAKNMKTEKSVFHVLELFPDLKPFQKESMRKLSLDFSKLQKKRPLEAIEFIESDLEYLKYLNEKSEFLGYGLESNLNLLSYIKSIASRCISILDFVARLDDLKATLSESRDGHGVLLSTIHSSKGLEFKNVFLVDLINGDFPSSSSIDAMKQGVLEPIEEERRLFYVGITRAKQNLNLLCYKYSDGKKLAPSMFLSEIERSLASESEEKLRVYGRIEHVKFGEGTVLDISESSLLVDFDDSGQKQLLKSACLEQNLISIID